MSDDRAPAADGRDETPLITTVEVVPIRHEEESTATAHAPGPAAPPVVESPRGDPEQPGTPSADRAAGLESTSLKVKAAAAGGTGLLVVLVKGTLSLLGKVLSAFVTGTMALGAFVGLVGLALAFWLYHDALPRVTKGFRGRRPGRGPEHDDPKLDVRLTKTDPSAWLGAHWSESRAAAIEGARGGAVAQWARAGTLGELPLMLLYSVHDDGSGRRATAMDLFVSCSRGARPLAATPARESMVARGCDVHVSLAGVHVVHRDLESVMAEESLNDLCRLAVEVARQ